MPKTRSEQPLPVTHERFISLSDQILGTYNRIDKALAHTLRLSSELVETADEMGLEPQVGQALFADLTNCVGSMVLSRQQFLKVHRRAHSIRKNTTVAWEGCPFAFDGEPATIPVLKAVA